MKTDRQKQIGELLHKFGDHLEIARHFRSLMNNEWSRKQIADEYFPDPDGTTGIKNPGYYQVCQYLNVLNTNSDTQSDLKEGKISVDQALKTIGKDTGRSKVHKFILNPTEAWRFAHRRSNETPSVLKSTVKQHGTDLVRVVLKAICD